MTSTFPHELKKFVLKEFQKHLDKEPPIDGEKLNIKNYFHFFHITDVEEQFDKLWKVITHREYDTNQEAFQRSASSDTFNNRWWTEEAIGPDEGFDY